jgi:hypothetical protein
MKQYNLDFIKRYKFEIAIIIITIAISCTIIVINEKISTPENNLNNYFWMPSSIMQSVAAIYALFVAILVMSIQNNQKVVSLIGDMLKPRFKIATSIVAFTIYFNGLVLFIFGHYKPIDSEVGVLYFLSLISLFVSLIVIVYTSFWMISTVAGLNTQDEILDNLSQGKDIEACYLALDLDIDKWFIKPKDQQDKEIKIILKLLENGTRKIRSEVAEFLRTIADTQTVDQLIKNLNSNNEDVRNASAYVLSGIGNLRALESLIKTLGDINSHVRSNSAAALGNIGDVRAVEPLIKSLDDKNKDVRQSSVKSLGKIRDLRAVEPLIKRLDDNDLDVIVSTEVVLGDFGDLRAVEPLIKKLKDPSDSVRQFAVRALDKIGDERAVKPLDELLKYEKAPNIRHLALNAIDKIKKQVDK